MLDRSEITRKLGSMDSTGEWLAVRLPATDVGIEQSVGDADILVCLPLEKFELFNALLCIDALENREDIKCDSYLISADMVSNVHMGLIPKTMPIPANGMIGKERPTIPFPMDWAWWVCNLSGGEWLFDLPCFGNIMRGILSHDEILGILPRRHWPSPLKIGEIRECFHYLCNKVLANVLINKGSYEEAETDYRFLKYWRIEFEAKFPHGENSLDWLPSIGLGPKALAECGAIWDRAMLSEVLGALRAGFWKNHQGMYGKGRKLEELYAVYFNHNWKTKTYAALIAKGHDIFAEFTPDEKEEVYIRANEAVEWKILKVSFVLNIHETGECAAFMSLGIGGNDFYKKKKIVKDAQSACSFIRSAFKIAFQQNIAANSLL